jgi:hypothetical protein
MNRSSFKILNINDLCPTTSREECFRSWTNSGPKKMINLYKSSLSIGNGGGGS